MLKPKRRNATYADLEALPPNMVGEIIHGVLYSHPRPAPRHAIAAFRLGSQIGGPFDVGGPGGWIFAVEPELHLGPEIIVPDLAGWRRERLTPFPTTAHISTPPDWLSEVLSPSTQALDRTVKLATYAEYGVGTCWYCDPIAETLEILVLSGDKWLLWGAFKGDDPVTAPPFEAHTFPLDSLWVRDEPDPASTTNRD